MYSLICPARPSHGHYRSDGLCLEHNPTENDRLDAHVVTFECNNKKWSLFSLFSRHFSLLHLPLAGGRDVAGYASHPPDPKWPHKAKVALNFVINYEEGGENCLLHGDGESEKLLSEIVGANAYSKLLPVMFAFLIIPAHIMFSSHQNSSLSLILCVYVCVLQKMNVMVCDWMFDRLVCFYLFW